ncbi:MAG: hypothetical protein HY071_02470 [Chloroflexi bacterium]|nr:hypothetical protein [Chloroflexota bacterium]
MRAGGAIQLLALRGRVDLRRALTNDLPLKAIAVVLTAIVWVVVAETAPKDVTQPFGGRVPIERPEIPAGYVQRGTLGDVAVKIRGPLGIVSSIGVQDLHATIDPTTIDLTRAGTQEVAVRVVSGDERVKVVEVAPAVVGLRVERVISRSLAVQARFANEPPSGFQPATPVFAPIEVKVSGPETSVAAVTAVFATVRFGDAGVDVLQSAQAQAVDASGAPVPDVTVEPAAVQANVPVLSTATTRTVPVLWALRGSVAPGFWVSRVDANPIAVTVRGPRSSIAALERIETTPIDVTGLASDRTVRVALTLPEGVTLVQATDASVTVVVVPLTGTRPFPIVAVQVLGVGQGLAADADPKTVDVVVSGTLAQLNALRPEDITATADATSKGVGSYPTDVVVRGPQGLTVSTVQPSRATVTIRAK